ncbi:radical SAM protein [Methanopyrus sp.]
MTCELCGGPASSFLRVCRECILNRWDESRQILREVHAEARRELGLPPEPPSEGLECGACVNRCRIPEGGVGYCGVVRNEGGEIVREHAGRAYLDPHPTNCVGAWVCPGATSRGYPKYTETRGPERGRYNLAVFYGGCTHHCFFCQNYEHWMERERLSAESLKRRASNPDVTCVCFFGGDPTPHYDQILEIGREWEELHIRVCLETNGSLRPKLMRRVAEICYESGGGFNMDVKAYDPRVYYALSFSDPEYTFENLETIGREFAREDPPILRPSTLVVPGYITPEEIEKIAEFLASIDERIPYRLLQHVPQYHSGDLGYTPVRTMRECKRAAERHLENVDACVYRYV